MAYDNPRITELVMPIIKKAIDDALTDAATEATTIAAAQAAAAVKVFIVGKADDLPAKADFVGQLFVKTGTTNPGLYVSTGTTTPGWKTVSHAS